MENNNLEKVEKEYWGKSFYGSKLNTVLLLILIVLMIFALKIMWKQEIISLPVDNTLVLVDNNQTSNNITTNNNSELSITKIIKENNLQESEIEGKQSCPQTFDGVKACYSGFKDLSGNVYALDYSLMPKENKFSWNDFSDTVIIKGTIVPVELLKSHKDYKHYQNLKIQGVMFVNKAINKTIFLFLKNLVFQYPDSKIYECRKDGISFFSLYKDTRVMDAGNTFYDNKGIEIETCGGFRLPIADNSICGKIEWSSCQKIYEHSVVSDTENLDIFNLK